MFEVEDKFKEDVIRDLKSKNLIVKEVLGRIVAKETDLHMNIFVCDMNHIIKWSVSYWWLFGPISAWSTIVFTVKTLLYRDDDHREDKLQFWNSTDIFYLFHLQLRKGKCMKAYSRSAADQEETLPTELRPAETLRDACWYLCSEICTMDKDSFILEGWLLPCLDKNSNLDQILFLIN